MECFFIAENFWINIITLFAYRTNVRKKGSVFNVVAINRYAEWFYIVKKSRLKAKVIYVSLMTSGGVITLFFL